MKVITTIGKIGVVPERVLALSEVEQFQSFRFSEYQDTLEPWWLILNGLNHILASLCSS